jgi:tetratricopeptide (TPR) repeat protein
MVDKNRSVADAKSTDRRAHGSQPRPTSRTRAVTAGAESPIESPAATQLAAFEAAMRLFHARRFAEARQGFQSAADGAERDIAQRAQLHIAMCDRRLPQKQATLTTAEEHYTYGVALLNTRNPAEARLYLERAVAMSPGSEHIHYALAAAQSLSGDAAGAVETLRRAIDLDPRNRTLARQDADFAMLTSYPAFRALLNPEKKGW